MTLSSGGHITVGLTRPTGSRLMIFCAASSTSSGRPLGGRLHHPPSSKNATSGGGEGDSHLALRPGPRATGLARTLQDVLHDRLQHHLLVRVLHQDEPGEVLEDQLLEPGQLLPGRETGQREGWSGPPVRPTLALRDWDGAAAEGPGQAGAEWESGVLTDLQVGASFLSKNGIVICSNASRKKRFRTELLS